MLKTDFNNLKIGDLVTPIGRSKDFGRIFIVTGINGNDIIVTPDDGLPISEVVVSETTQQIINNQRGYKYQAMKRA